MGSFSGLGIGLSFVFGCILMGLVGELYYLLWWKKRIVYSNSSNRDIHKFSSLFLCCWQKPISSNSSGEIPNSVRNSQEEGDLEMGSNKDLGVKSYDEEGVETELMRMHNLCGPPRFLFTIKEESKEDLESDDGKSRKGSRTKSLSDVVFGVDTPFLTPLSSPTVKSLDSYHNHGFNPLFEAEINRLRSSPPPKLKFLKDAEDKLMRRMLMEERGLNNEQDSAIKDSQEEKDASFVKFTNQAAQILPLASSPTVLDKKYPLQ